MSIPLAVFLGCFALLFAFNVPIGFVLLMPSTLYLYLTEFDLAVVPQKIVSGMDSFVLLAIPLFILAAELMNTTGITDRIFRFANSIVGRIPGGLAHANVLASMIFAGMSGSAAADASGLGLMEIEAMTKEGYDRPFSAAVTAASATIGCVIPPSITMVIYGSIAQASVGRLFAGGFIPGILMGVGMMIVNYVRAVQRQYPHSKTVSFKLIVTDFRKAFFGLLAPVILLGGIYTGVFTPTEAAAVAAVYALLVGLFIYREVKPRDLRRVLMNTVINTAIVLFVMGAASVFGWVLTVEQIPLKLTEYFLSLHLQPWSLLLILNILFLILGCFMEINTILLIFLPIILPVLQRFGIDLVHFGVVMVLNLMIGTITPPFGMIMYITSGIAKVPMAEVIKELVPFYIVLIAVLMLITYVPQIVLFLPNLLFK